MNHSLRGIIIPAATPFDENGALDLAAMAYNYQQWVQTDICGIMCLGSNGEFRSLSDEESLGVIRVASEQKGDKALIVGVGRESLHHTVSFIRKVAESGAAVDYYSVLTPCYFASNMTDEALYHYYTGIADAAPAPVLLYVAPKFTNGVKISPELLCRLADHPNIAGIKDTSSDMMNTYMDAVGGRDDFFVLAGSISNLMTCLDRGGAGGVVSAANFSPAECAEITRLYFAGEQQAARDLHTRMRDVIGRTGGKYATPGLKATMNLVGLKAGVPRSPLMALQPAIVEQIRETLTQEGFLHA